MQSKTDEKGGLMKNIATNRKLILLMLITAFLTCWIQTVSYGGGAVGGIVDTVGAVGGLLGPLSVLLEQLLG